MRRVLVWIAVSVGAALALAGCGGKKRYGLESTRACLAKAGLKPLPPARADRVAQFAPDGAVRIVFGRRNEVTISFADDENGARQIALGYERFHGKNIGLADVLRPQRNAVLLWEAHPSDQDAAAISRCLK